MATLIPAFRTYSQRMTSGKRRCAQRLEAKREADYLLWYDVPVGQKRLYPDFVIFHPLRGIIILEIKDWKLSTIQDITPDIAIILTDTGPKTEKNPLLQAQT